MSCTNPIDVAILADYWLAALPQLEENAVEEHLFSCDECGDRLREVIEFAEALRRLACEGSLRMIASSAFLQRATEAGLQVREYEQVPGGSVQCTITEKDDLLIAHFAADLSEASRVDLCFFTPDGTPLGRLEDVPFRSDSSEIVYQESSAFAKGAPDNVMIAKMVSIDPSGGERLLGEYTFNHTRTIPGPPAWGN